MVLFDRKNLTILVKASRNHKFRIFSTQLLQAQRPRRIAPITLKLIMKLKFIDNSLGTLIFFLILNS